MLNSLMILLFSLKLLIDYFIFQYIYCFSTSLACKSDDDCNSHGACDKTKQKCSCEPEYTGGQCEKKTSKLCNTSFLEDHTPYINM